MSATLTPQELLATAIALQFDGNSLAHIDGYTYPEATQAITAASELLEWTPVHTGLDKHPEHVAQATVGTFIEAEHLTIYGEAYELYLEATIGIGVGGRITMTYHSEWALVPGQESEWDTVPAPLTAKQLEHVFVYLLGGLDSPRRAFSAAIRAEITANSVDKARAAVRLDKGALDEDIVALLACKHVTTKVHNAIVRAVRDLTKDAYSDVYAAAASWVQATNQMISERRRKEVCYRYNTNLYPFSGDDVCEMLNIPQL